MNTLKQGIKKKKASAKLKNQIKYWLKNSGDEREKKKKQYLNTLVGTCK